MTTTTDGFVKTLHSELEGQLEDTSVDAEERLKSVENEKDYYKTQASVAMEDLDRGKIAMTGYDLDWY